MDEMQVRHPLHPSFRLPATFVALTEFILDGLDPEDPDVWRYASWMDNGVVRPGR